MNFMSFMKSTYFCCVVFRPPKNTLNIFFQDAPTGMDLKALLESTPHGEQKWWVFSWFATMKSTPTTLSTFKLSIKNTFLGKKKRQNFLGCQMSFLR